MNCPRCGTELVNAGSIKTGEYHEAVVTRGMGFGEPGPLHTPDRCADVLKKRNDELGRLLETNQQLRRELSDRVDALKSHILDRDRLLDFDARGVVELTDKIEAWKSRYETCKALLLKFRGYGWMGKAGRAEVDAALAASQAPRKEG
jgi:hypothetical protein